MQCKMTMDNDGSMDEPSNYFPHLNKLKIMVRERHTKSCFCIN